MISDELAAQLNSGQRPTLECPDCHAVRWYQRTTANGGGWVCGVCHPDPTGIIVNWSPRWASSKPDRFV